MKDEKAVEIIESMVKFMDNTNKVLAEIVLRLNNIDVDISNLKHQLKKQNRILISN